MNFKSELKQAIVSKKSSLLIHCWNEDFPGSDLLDKICDEISLEYGGKALWESVRAENTGQKNLLFSLDFPPIKNSNRQIGDRPKTTKTIRIETNLIEELERRSQSTGKTQTQIIEAALRQYFE